MYIPAIAFGTRSTAALTDCFCSGGVGQEMSAVEADFCGTASRIPAVKAEVLYEYDSKHRAAYLGVSSHKENGVSSTPTNKPDYKN